MVEAPGLSARPPTPPKASSRTLPRDENDCAQDSPIFQTPGDSPRVANGSAAPSTRTSKKVNFSLSPKFIKPPTFTNSDSKPYSDIKVLTPSNECKPVKSILKATQSPVPVGRPNAPPDTPESFAMLLESVTQQLAGESMSARLDAYMQLFGALMAYDGLPSEQEMSGKLGLVSEFIQRDLIKSSGHGGPLDTNLAIQALKLSVAFIWSPGISAHLSDDFRIFLIDYSISCLQDDQVPKSVVTHWMSILSTQSFPPRIMTNTRMTRALTVLHELTKRVKGNSIISQRLSIYQRFLNQAKSAFVSQAALWMEHLVAGLLYHKKESRIKAISLGFQISNTFGPNQSLSKSVREVLDRPIEGGTTKMVSEVIGRLQVMMNLPDGAAHVPQAWSIVILLLRSKNLSLDQWEHFKNWVLVLQKCFNRNESSIKAQAILGWNRFVFAISPNESTSPSLLKMLRKPILSQFERKKQDKNATQPTQLALSSYYNLLYYAFRPSAPHSHVDAVWEEYVSGPAVNTFALSPALCDPFSQALANLLWSPQGKVWVENRATETNKIDPEELPSLDCRWIRSRISSVLKVFENILKSSVWDNDTIEKSNIAAAWISLSKSLSYASSKEITPSTESMQAVAHILGLLQRIWKAGPPSLNAAVDQPMDCFFDRFQFLSTTMIYSIGSIPFTEKLLLKATDETFQIANTPTHRHPRGDSNLVSPIVHLLQLISDKHDMAEISSSYVHLVDGILGAACGGRASRGSRLELLRQCAELYSMEDGFPFGVDHFRLVVWKTTARLAAETLSTFPTESTRERDGSVPRDYENILKILSIGLRFSDYLQAWNQLLNSFIQVVKSERGDLVIAAMVIEPVAEYVMRYGAPVYLPSVTLITHALTAPYPESLRDTEEPGSSIVAYTARPGQPTFPHRLLELAGKVLQGSYSGFTSSDASRVADLFESLASFLGCGALNYRSLILEHLQGSLALWLKDEAQHLGPEPGKESRILSSVSG